MWRCLGDFTASVRGPFTGFRGSFYTGVSVGSTSICICRSAQTQVHPYFTTWDGGNSLRILTGFRLALRMSVRTSAPPDAFHCQPCSVTAPGKAQANLATPPKYPTDSIAASCKYLSEPPASEPNRTSSRCPGRAVGGHPGLVHFTIPSTLLPDEAWAKPQLPASLTHNESGKRRCHPGVSCPHTLASYLRA